MRFLALKHILIAADLADESQPAASAAARLAEAAGATLDAVHVTGSADQTDNTHYPTMESTPDLMAALHRVGAALDPRRAHVLGGNPAEAIGSLAAQIGADVIVLGPHRKNWDVSQAGGRASTALALVTSVSAPCLIVSQALTLPLERVLVPVDRSDTARGALVVGLTWASALRGGKGTTLTALHVGAPSDDDDHRTIQDAALERELEFARGEAGTWAGVSISGAAKTNADAADGIVAYAASYRPDLVVLGTRGMGLDQTDRLGSVAARVLHRLQAPVLLVPPAVWRSTRTV